MTFANYARYLLWGIMGLSVILTIIFYFGPVVDPYAAYVEPKITNVFIKYSYVLFILTVVGTLAFSIMNLVQNSKNLKNAAIVLVVAAVIFVLSRSLASDVLLELGESYKGGGNVAGVLKNVGTGLIATYVLLFGTVLAILYSEVSKMLK